MDNGGILRSALFFFVPEVLQLLLLLCVVTVLLCMAPPPPLKRKRVVLSLEKKREILGKVDAGWTTSCIRSEYGLSASTLHDIKKAREKLMSYTTRYSEASRTGRRQDRKVMASPKNVELDKCVLHWYQQQRGSGVMVRGAELKMAAEKFATRVGMNDFKASDGWLYRFKFRHGLSARRTHGEALDADEGSVSEFRQKLLKLIDDESIVLDQLYNADETGLNYRSIPECTLASQKEKSVPGHKLSKVRVSVMCCANATGLHRLKPVVVGKAKQPRCLRGVMESLPVVYFNSLKAWFTARIFKDWFNNHAVPEIIRHQTDALKIPLDRVKALILLDNAPAHPVESELVGHHGRIRCLFLPPNTTALIQPMDQGIIVATKRLYRRRFLEEVMVVFEDDDDGNVGERTLERLRKYDLKSAMFNWSRAWKDVKSKTLENGWKPLLRGEETAEDFEGFQVDDFRRHLVRVGETVTDEGLEDWLENDEGDPGCQMLSDDEIASQVLSPEDPESDVEDDSELPTSRPSLSKMRECADILLEGLEHFSSPESLRTLAVSQRSIRDEIIQQQSRWSSYRQTTLDSFFRPTTPRPPSSTPSPSSVTPSSSTVPRLVTPSPSRPPSPVAGCSGVAPVRRLITYSDSSDEEKELQDIEDELICLSESEGEQ